MPTNPSTVSEKRDSRFQPSRLWIHAGLFVVVVGVYLPSVEYGFLDDETVILFRMPPPDTVSELVARSFSPHFPGLAYLRPLPHASYLIQYMIDRNSAAPFHLLNAVLMGTTACISFAFLSLPGFRIAVVPAILGSLIFAVHPASSSTVIPIVGRETLMAAGLTIGSVFAFARGTDRWMTASMILLALSLLSKEQAIVIPILFVLADICGISENVAGCSWRQRLQRYRRPALIVAVYLLLRWSMFSGSEFQFNFVKHPEEVFLSIRFAIQTIFAPYVELMYEPAASAWLSGWRCCMGCLAAMMLMIAVYRLRPRLWHPALFWSGWVLVSIAPTANIIRQQAMYSERYVMLAVFGMAGLSAGVLSTVQSGSFRRWLTAAACLLLLVSGVVTVGRGQYFATQMAFAKQWAATNPEFAETQMSLGTEYYLSGQVDKAADCFRSGMAVESGRTRLCRNWLAKMLLLQRHFDEAGQLFAESPNEKFACLLHGVALQRLGRTLDAQARFEAAVHIDRAFSAAHFLLAENAATIGDVQRARSHAEMAAGAQVLDLSFAFISDKQLQTIAEYPELRMLVLKNTLITDHGLSYIRDFRRLERLWIPGTAITDAGVRHLREHATLRSLVISNTSITDTCVDSLITIPHLNHLDIRYTDISQTGIRRLKEKLSDCQIYY